MRVVPCVLVIAWLCLGATGCSLFNKRAKEGERPASTTAKGKEPAKFPSAGDPIREGTADAGEYGGLLAGTVFDPYNSHPKEAHVRWIDLDDPKQPETPIDVAVSPEGYFTIRGLKPNHHYKLVARAKDGSRLLAGVTYSKAPNIHIVIRLREDTGSGGVPPLPGAPVYTPKTEEQNKEKKEEKKENKEEPKSSQGGSQRPAAAQVVPAWGPSRPENASLGGPNSLSGPGVPDLPAQVNVPIPVSNPPPSSGWVPGIAGNGASWPPRAEIPPLQGKAGPAILIDRPIPLSGGNVSLEGDGTAIKGGSLSTRVPSCVLVGKQLINLALHDLKHQPWEFRTGRKGKLVLFDFWGTMCIPCREAIPHLRILQSQYGAAGLEVIGIAYEHGDTFEEQARRVSGVSQRLLINYRMLLGGGSDCPVRSSFNVRVIPTLVLLDENGWILWRHEGRPDRYHLEELELIIKRRLGL